jgi:hypothetical protein
MKASAKWNILSEKWYILSAKGLKLPQKGLSLLQKGTSVVQQRLPNYRASSRSVISAIILGDQLFELRNLQLNLQTYIQNLRTSK